MSCHVLRGTRTNPATPGRKVDPFINSDTMRSSNGEWRLKTNEELEETINNENIVRYIKYKRLSWLGHVERMANERVAKTIYKWKPYVTRPKGRPRVRWEDDVRHDLRKILETKDAGEEEMERNN